MFTIRSVTHSNSLQGIHGSSSPLPLKKSSTNIDRSQYAWSSSHSRPQNFYPVSSDRSGYFNIMSSSQKLRSILSNGVVESSNSFSSKEKRAKAKSAGTSDKHGRYLNEDDFSVPITPSYMSTTNSPPPTAKSMLPASGMNNIGNPTKLNPSFYNHLMKLESWSNWIGMNLLATKYRLDSKGHWRAKGHSRILIYSIRGFFILNLIHVILSYRLVEETDSRMMFYVGDFSNIFGEHIDRYSLNACKFFWGLHATVVYWWITRANGMIRVWLYFFEGRWLETMYYVNKDLENESLHRMRRNRWLVSKFIHVSYPIHVRATVLF